jgi:Aminomethyltransferase folate-binding domain
MVELFGEDVPEVPYYFLRCYELEGMPVLVSRTAYTAELGYEIYLFEASRHGQRLWDAVLEAGRPHGLAVIGPSHIRRIEGGILAYGADMWLDTNPYEVGMGYDWMVDLEQKADFIGKDALARIKQQGSGPSSKSRSRAPGATRSSRRCRSSTPRRRSPSNGSRPSTDRRDQVLVDSLRRPRPEVNPRLRPTPLANLARVRIAFPGQRSWLTTSMLFPSGSSTNAV